MSTAVATSIHDRRLPQPQPGGRLGAAQAVATVVGMELRQRLRSRGWYVLLGVFFVVVGAVTLGALGLPARVQEWFNQTPAGAPYTFRLLLDVDQTPLTQADLVKILEVVERTKNLRSHLEVALLTITSVAAPSVAVVAGLGLDLGVSYSAPAYADGTPALDLLTDAAEYGEASTVAALDALHTLLHSTLTPSYW